MPADFTGLLQSRHKQSRALRVSIAFPGETVELSTELGFIGRWPSEDVLVERSRDNWFNLTLDQEEWKFLADDPTGFFLAAPLQTPGQVRARTAASSRRLTELSKGVVGATLAVFLLSLGIVIGRNRIDGNVLVVTIMLILAAALGFWWATLKTQRQEQSQQHRRPGTAMRIDRPQTALRVEDVIRKREPQASESKPSSPASPELPDGSAIGVDSAELSEHDASVGSAQEHTSSVSPKTGALTYDDVVEPERDPDTDSGWIEVPFDPDRGEVHVRAALGGPPFTDGITASVEEREDPLLPTAAVKRYLASLARSTDTEAKQRDFEPTVIETMVADRDGSQGSDGAMDLTEIRGIGPAISNALSRLGVSDVHDLAKLDSDDLDYLEVQLGRFGSRVRSERWVEQARQMVRDR